MKTPLFLSLGAAFVTATLAYVGTADGNAMAQTEVSVERWQCRNDLEVRCSEGRCETASADGFTPMSVSADASGAMTVCAYSGCWEGTGEVLESGRFLVLVGVGLDFSTSRNAESAADIAIAIDRTDRVATLKAEEFAHPLLCERVGATRPAADP